MVDNSQSDDIARDFNEMTRTGKRNCMADEFFNIWFRSILKQIIKPERFILVSENLNDARRTPNYKRKCGQLLDAILESLEKYEDAFLGKPNCGNGYKIDDCIRKFLPELLNSHVKPFALNNEGCPLDMNLLEKWGKDEIALTKEQLVVHAGKLSFIRWEIYAFIKGGGAMGENTGKLTQFTHEQMKKADIIASSVLGTDAGVLAPKTYSCLFKTELQNSFKWNKEKMMWVTSEFPVNTKDSELKIDLA